VEWSAGQKGETKSDEEFSKENRFFAGVVESDVLRIGRRVCGEFLFLRRPG
jgi:hypothetical protein